MPTSIRNIRSRTTLLVSRPCCLATIGQLGGPLWLFEDPWKPLAESMLQLPEAKAEHASQLVWVSDADDLGRRLDAWLETRPARRAEGA